MRTEYKDSAGRRFVVELPEGADIHDAQFGRVIGPPYLDFLGLPLAIEVRLNNALFVRSLITKQDIKRRQSDVFAALQSALGVEAAKIMEAYQ